MKASVVIPCYNAEKTLPEQLEAFSRQHWSESWEIILADIGIPPEVVKQLGIHLEPFFGGKYWIPINKKNE